MSATRIRKCHSFSAVPDELFELDLSPAAFKVASWALGRPDGWHFNISYMLNKLRLSDKVWRSVKRELIKAGFFQQRRHFGERNRIRWENEFTDAPLWQAKESSIPPSGTDGGGINAGDVDIAEDAVSKVLKAAACAPASDEARSPTQIRLKKQTTPIKSIIIIDNNRDQDLVDSMLAKHGMDKLEETARQIIGEGFQPFPSNIAKKLGHFVTNVGDQTDTRYPRPDGLDHAKLKTLMHLVNDGDVFDWQQLVNEFGGEAVEAEAAAVRKEGRPKVLPWPSTIKARLNAQRASAIGAAARAKAEAEEKFASEQRAAKAALISRHLQQFEMLGDNTKEDLMRQFETYVSSNSFLLALFIRDGLSSLSVRAEFAEWLVKRAAA